MESYLDESSAATATLTYDGKEVEVALAQVTSATIALIFNLNPETIWLQESIGSRIYIPDDDGSFSLHSSSAVYGLRVNGVLAAAPQTQQQAPQSAHTATTSSTGTGSASGRPFFCSVTNRKSGGKIKIVRAELSYAQNGRPNFTNIDVIFLDINEENANAGNLIQAVKEQFGIKYTIVSNDGLEIKDSPGTRGIKFWKTPSRKLFAVDRSSLRGKSRHQNDDADQETSSGAMTSAAQSNAVPSGVMKEIVGTLKDFGTSLGNIQLAMWANSGTIPSRFKEALVEAFKCKICQTAPFKPPIIMAKCCTNVIGCQTCADRWFSGTNALSKNCPICQHERGYAQTARLHGFDEIAEEVRQLLSKVDQDATAGSLDTTNTE